jgi:hypothetical protein
MGKISSLVRNTATILFLAIGLAGLILSFLTVKQGLIGWDSPIDTTGFLDISSLPAGASLAIAYEAIWTTSEFYGILIQQSGLALQCVFTGQCSLPDAYAVDTYLWQGMATIGIAAMAAIAVSFAVFVATKNKIAATITWAFATSFPVVVGLNSVDYKDSPLASGLAIFCAGITIFWVLQEKMTTWLNYWPLLIISTGSFIALAVRPASWTILLAIGVSATILFFGVEKNLKKKPSKPLVTKISLVYAAAVAGLIPLYLTNPLARISLIKWLYDSYVVMSHYPVESTVLTAGVQLNTADLPWWYIPAWIFAQMPMITVVILVTSALIALFAFFKPRTMEVRNSWPLASFLILGILVPLVAIITQATMYDGIRHSLYIFAPLATLIGLGYVAISELATNKSVITSVALIIFLAAGLTNLASILRWFPYQYAYLNEIASINSGTPDWEVDYWGLSQQEAVSKFKEQGVSTVKISGMQPVSMGIYGISNGAPGAGEGLFFGIRGGQAGEIPQNCVEDFNITRDDVLLSRGYLCSSE